MSKTETPLNPPLARFQRLRRVRLPLRLPPRRLRQKWAVAAAIALAASLLALALRITPRATEFVYDLDDLLYDTCYRLRPDVDKTDDASVIVIAVDDAQLNEVDKAYGFGWPWPREFYVPAVRFAAAHGARAVVFDLLMNRTSYYAHGEAPDDELFAQGVEGAGVPLVFATVPEAADDPDALRFGPPMSDRPDFGAANISDAKVTRVYKTRVHGMESLALRAVRAAGHAPPDWASRPSFRLHYYGPGLQADGPTTFRYVPALSFIRYERDRAATAANGKPAANGTPPALAPDPAAYGIDPAWFKDKIVLVATVAAGTYDLKASPLSAKYPGVELHATAVENMVSGRRVRAVGSGAVAAVTFLGALVASLGAMFPRHVVTKLLAAALTLTAMAGVGVLLFQGGQILWLPLAAPLIATSVAVVGAFAWSYFTEDRSRRFILRALAQYVSPAVADELARDPSKLALGGERREMTVMFSDIAGFTDMSERMRPEQLIGMLNYYLDEMSKVVLNTDGTLDKYIGDAIMSFWNAPLSQPDHAERACRAALAMWRRERAIQDELVKLGATGMLTRIGINSGPMAIGNMGSTHRFSYTVVGDSVNLASRLEGANKLYGTQILIADSTRRLVEGRFLVRPLDLLRVKGKTEPVPVFELMDEGAGDAKAAALAARFGDAFRAYLARDWGGAEQTLLDIRREYPHDGPAAMLLERVGRFRQNPPPVEWDGVFVMKDK